MPTHLGRHLILTSGLLLATMSPFLGSAAFAAEEPQPPTATEWQAGSASAGNRPGALTNMFREGPTGGLWQRNQLLGDPGGLRSWMGKYGASLTIQETSELLGNTSGGIKTGFAYDGLTTVDLQVDTKRAFNLYGGLFNASALYIHGTNLSAHNLGTLQTASGIEADNTVRLWELWYQQMFDFNQMDIKVGNQSLDQEFMVSQYAGLFVNTMFGWPMVPSADMLGGGPAYPLASPGIRFHAQPSGQPWAFLVGAFDDNPGGINPQSAQDPQVLNSHGTNFRVHDPYLFIAEVQFSVPAIGQLEYADRAPILPGTYKLGAWYDTGSFADQRYGTDGLSLANSSSNKTAQLHNHNYSLYAVMDQLLWRENAESAEGVGMFVRAMGAPAEQNPIEFSLNAGLSWHAPFKHREYDVAGLGMGLARVSDRARSLDMDTNAFSGSQNPVRNSETFVELTYQYQVVPWWVLQPDVQYTWSPGGGLVNPNNSSQTIGNELVLGLRTNISL